MSGDHLHILLGNLSRYFHGLDLGEIEDLLESDLERARKKHEEESLQDKDDSDDECLSAYQTPKIYSKLQGVMQGYECTDLLQEIYNDAVGARKETGITLKVLINYVFKQFFL